MHFKLPQPLQEWIERRISKDKLETLICTIGDVNSLIQSNQGHLSKVARRHIIKADEDYQMALAELQNKDGYAECLRRTESGLFRLELAKQQMAHEQERPCAPRFAAGTAEHAALTLSAAIIRTKICLEYNNCVVSEATRQQLVAVVKQFNNAIEAQKAGHVDKAKSTAEAGLLHLYLLTKEIARANKESVVTCEDAYLSENKHPKILKSLVDALYSVIELCDFSATSITEIDGENHAPATDSNDQIEEALNDIYAIFTFYAAGETDKMKALRDAVKIKIAMIEKNMRTGQNQKRPEDIKERANEDSRAAAINSGPRASSHMRLKQFKTQIILLERLVNNRAPQAVLAKRRLDAVLESYTKALALYYKRTNLQEANALISAARLELDFARHILDCNTPNQKRTL